MVLLNWRGAKEQITVGMIPALGEDLIIGPDYDNFTSLLAKASQENVTNTWWEEAPYGKAEVEESPLRLKLSRKQEQEQRRYYHATSATGSLKPAPEAATVLTTVGSFRQAQPEDPTLKNAWQQALSLDERLEAERTDTAAANPEGEGSTTNPLRLPGPKEKLQTLRASLPVQKRRTEVNEKRGAEGAGEVGGDDRGIVHCRENDREPSGLEELSECGPEGFKALPAVQEAPANFPATLQEKRGHSRCVPLAGKGKARMAGRR
ncbi:hypothetical protein NDU88_012683 [Pleurodeles waltl]|uniref:Uncharacterized protein n=1 Tax=Pleurodeles waltl TaxID=8319 RepID=A0AAV7R0R8_PLEWA|nr:hypothetical protein NDU88_012683 [Pleurodeles waltl]